MPLVGKGPYWGKIGKTIQWFPTCRWGRGRGGGRGNKQIGGHGTADNKRIIVEAEGRLAGLGWYDW